MCPPIIASFSHKECMHGKLLFVGKLTNLYNLGHFLYVDDAIPINVVHTECPLQLLFRRAARRDIDRQQELLSHIIAHVNISAVLFTPVSYMAIHSHQPSPSEVVTYTSLGGWLVPDVKLVVQMFGI